MDTGIGMKLPYIESSTVGEVVGKFSKASTVAKDDAYQLAKSTGNGKHLNDVPKIKEIEVNFNRNVKHDSEEFARQLKDQEKGMNELTVDEYLKNRERYIAQGRAIEGNAAQQAALHNPDQIAGGKVEIIGGMGDKRINSSIGSQWRYRIDIVDEQIKELAKNMTPEKLKSTYLNVKLTH
ncbi:polymorphic toxin type 15 domain-containing protein [Bacillus cereus]|uniref:polymorphic toxin type 15 domain-containing protein n=1 Tax=Bacillus cereus TaxID=1396 RepID=UPI00217D858D|nr:polymorphic toxin type 15 domain-containing protein [Bacillus cereus]